MSTLETVARVIFGPDKVTMLIFNNHTLIPQNNLDESRQNVAVFSTSPIYFVFGFICCQKRETANMNSL